MASIRSINLIKTALVLSLVVGAIVAATLPAEAQGLFDDVCTQTPTAEVCTDQNRELFGSNGAFRTIADTLAFLSAGIAIIVVIIGGIRYIISGGDQNAVATARKTVTYGLVGLGVVAISYAILRTVSNILQ